MFKACTAALLALTLLAPHAPAAGSVTVSAAASLTEALERVGEDYRQAHGVEIRYNFAGSNVLSRQIVSGAPVDLFISADQAQMDLAARAGAIDASTRIDLLGNRLAVVTRPGTPLADELALAAPGIRRIAVGDPAAVPAGVYAREHLAAFGLWDVLQPRLVPVSNVRAALAAVENGSVDAAIVYETDAAVSSRVALAFVVSGPAAPRIRYPAAVVRAGRNRAEAIRFLAYLQSEQAGAVFRRFGFAPVAGESR